MTILRDCSFGDTVSYDGKHYIVGARKGNSIDLQNQTTRFTQRIVSVFDRATIISKSDKTKNSDGKETTV